MKYDKKYFTTQSVKDASLYEMYRRFIESEEVYLNNKKICDIGCATGNFLETVLLKNECYGLDISEHAISQCKKRFPKLKDHFVVADIDKKIIQFNKKFDIITMFDVIEHIHNFANFNSFLKSHLARDGFLIITTPNANSFLRFLSKKTFTGEIDATHTILFTPYTLDFFLKRLDLVQVSLFTPFSFYFKKNAITKKILLGGQIIAIYRWK